MNLSRPRWWLSWSTGKDSAWALHGPRRAGELVEEQVHRAGTGETEPGERKEP